jgi:hypothetical protein
MPRAKRTKTSANLPRAVTTGRSKRTAANPTGQLDIPDRLKAQLPASVTVISFEPDPTHGGAYVDVCKILSTVA